METCNQFYLTSNCWVALTTYDTPVRKSKQNLGFPCPAQPYEISSFSGTQSHIAIFLAFSHLAKGEQNGTYTIRIYTSRVVHNIGCHHFQICWGKQHVRVTQFQRPLPSSQSYPRLGRALSERVQGFDHDLLCQQRKLVDKVLRQCWSHDHWGSSQCSSLISKDMILKCQYGNPNINAHRQKCTYIYI